MGSLRGACRILLLLVTVLSATAQERASSVSGVVRDVLDGVVVGVTIEVRNTTTGVTRTVHSDDRGNYRAPLLELGVYEVTASRVGFRSSRHEGVVLELDREAVVDHVLEVGPIADEVIVRGEARLVEASPSAVSSLVDSTDIGELPLNGRDYAYLTALHAGAPVARVQARNVNNGYGVQFSIAGSRPFQNSFLLDGVSLTTYNGSTPASINGVNLGVDAIREFSVQTSTPGAQYGRTAGGIVHAATRSGTNEVHGSLFYFHRNDNLDARNFFDDRRPEFRRHQYGASLGGPVLKNRTFFFANYEALRESRGNTQIDTTLSAQARSGNLTRGVVAVDPVMAKVAALYPLPNGDVFGDTGLFHFANSEVGDEDFVTTRIDQNLSDLDRLFFRYSFDDGSRVDETNFALGRRRNGTRNQSLAFEHTHIFSPTLINTARFGFLRTYTVGGATETQVQGTDDPSLAFLPASRIVGIISVAGLTEFPGGTGALDSDIHAFNSFQYSNDVTWIRGAHSLRFGGRLERTQFNTNSQNRVSGEFRFPGIAELLTNRPDRFRAQFPGSDTVRGFRQWIGAWYVQDTWRIRPQLDIEIGLRYEAASVPTEVNGKISNLDELTSPAMRVGDPLFDNPSLLNFSPRIGVAYDVFGDGRTVLRSGFGVYPDLILSHFLLLAGLRNPPFFERGATTVLFQGDFPSNAYRVFAADPDGDLRAERIPRDLDQPRVEQWNFNIEQRLDSDTTLRLAYLGSRGSNLSSYTEDANLVEPVTLADGRLFFPEDGERINPYFSWIRNRTFDAHSSYHGLQVQFRRRFRDGFLAQASYSFSKSIDDSSMFFSFSESSNSVSLPLNGHPSFYRGPSSYDVRHSLVANVVWDLPGPPSGAARLLFGGWRLGAVTTYASGFPMSARLRYDAARTKTSAPDGTGGQAPDLAPGASNNPVTGDPNGWVDTGAFRRPEPGFLGNLGRNTIRGPDLANVDLSISRQVRMWFPGEGATADFRFEFFNLLNRANFDLPAVERMEIFTATSRREDAGRITSAGRAREIQIGLKLRF